MTRVKSFQYCIANSPFSVEQRLRVFDKFTSFFVFFFVTIGRAPKKGRGEGVIKIGNKKENIKYSNKMFFFYRSRGLYLLNKGGLYTKLKRKHHTERSGYGDKKNMILKTVNF